MPMSAYLVEQRGPARPIQSCVKALDKFIFQLTELSSSGEHTHASEKSLIGHSNILKAWEQPSLEKTCRSGCPHGPSNQGLNTPLVIVKTNKINITTRAKNFITSDLTRLRNSTNPNTFFLWPKTEQVTQILNATSGTQQTLAVSVMLGLKNVSSTLLSLEK